MRSDLSRLLNPLMTSFGYKCQKSLDAVPARAMEHQDDITSLIGSIYATAVDTEGFAALLELADTRLNNDTHRRRFEALRSNFETHVVRAEALIGALPKTGLSQENPNDPCPRFDLDRRLHVISPNPAAQDLLGLCDGAPLDTLELTTDTLRAIKRFATGQSDHAPVLRLTRKDTGKPMLLRCQTRGGRETVQCFGVDIPWHDGASSEMRALYELTASENEVLGLLVEGHSPQEVAEVRDRSIETIRQQIKAMFRKTGTTGTLELLHLGRVVCVSSAQIEDTTRAQDQNHALRLPDGRSMSYRDIGSPTGRPIIFLHGCLGGNRLPKAAEAKLSRLGLRWIAPARPWHGSSDGWPALVSDPSRYGEDLRTLADRLDLKDITLVGYDAGAALACCAAGGLGARLRRVIALAITPPMQSMRDFAAAPTQQRILALAAKTSVPFLRYLSIVGDRKLRLEGREAFADTVFRNAPADLRACCDPEVLDLMWEGHFFHVAQGNDSFINDCRLIASDWSAKAKLMCAPLHLVHGGADQIVPLSRARSFAQSFGASLTVIEHAGHSLPFSHWLDVLHAVTEDGPE